MVNAEKRDRNHAALTVYRKNDTTHARAILMPSPEQWGPLVVGSDRSGGSGMSFQQSDFTHSDST
jgi:hypothetical protein